MIPSKDASTPVSFLIIYTIVFAWVSISWMPSFAHPQRSSFSHCIRMEVQVSRASCRVQQAGKVPYNLSHSTCMCLGIPSSIKIHLKCPKLWSFSSHLLPANSSSLVPSTTSVVVVLARCASLYSITLSSQISIASTGDLSVPLKNTSFRHFHILQRPKTSSCRISFSFPIAWSMLHRWVQHVIKLLALQGNYWCYTFGP